MPQPQKLYRLNSHSPQKTSALAESNPDLSASQHECWPTASSHVNTSVDMTAKHVDVRRHVKVWFSFLSATVVSGKNALCFHQAH